MKSLLSFFSISILLSQLALAGTQDDLFTATAQCDLEGVKKAIAGGTDCNCASGLDVIPRRFRRVYLRASTRPLAMPQRQVCHLQKSAEGQEPHPLWNRLQFEETLPKQTQRL
ncbi:MAG: hypothetical protein ACI9FU_001696 [Granulosicoccus sp.]|jgi:hypothetical protein